jgi:hypothetical protein
MATTDPIVTALQQQVEGYRTLLRLGEAQRRHVQTGQTDSLLAVLQQRQGVIDRIMAAEQTVGPAKRDWAKVLSALPAEQRATATNLLAETRRMLEQITAADRDDVVLLQQQKLNLGRQINRTSAARAVNRNYAVAAYGRPRSRVDLSQ